SVPCTPFINVKDGAHGVMRPTLLSAVLQLRCAGRACAVDAAEDFSLHFHAVADDTAVTVRAKKRKRGDCALETVESMTLSAHDHFKRLVVIVLANFACRHTKFVRARGGLWRCLFGDRTKIERHRVCTTVLSLTPRFSEVLCAAITEGTA